MGLDNPDNWSMHFVMYDKQLHRITLKITLNAKRSKSPRLCFTNVTESQILGLAPIPAVFLLTAAILKQVHRMTPKWP